MILEGSYLQKTLPFQNSRLVHLNLKNMVVYQSRLSGMPSFRLHHHPSKSVNDEIHQSDRLWSVGGINYGSITHDASMGMIYLPT